MVLFEKYNKNVINWMWFIFNNLQKLRIKDICKFRIGKEQM